MNITRNNLLGLISRNQITPGEEYTITDYSSKVFPKVTGISADKVSKKADNGVYSMIYDIETNIISFLSDGNITGDCDWTRYDISGTNIRLGTIPDDAVDFKVRGNNITTGGGNYLIIDNCSDIIIGDNNRAALLNSSFVTIGNGNEALVEDSDGVYVGDDNTDIHITGNGVEVNDGNVDVNITTGKNIIGSGNKRIMVHDSSNVVKNGCTDVELRAGNNFIDKSSYVAVEGQYNAVTGSSAAGITGYGNMVRSSQTISLEGTNNNDIYMQELTLANKTAFQRYRPNSYGGIVKVNENIIITDNRQSDNVGTVLRIEENTLDVETKGKNKYELKDGIWQTIN